MAYAAIIFVVAAVALLALNGMLAATIFSTKFKLWPVPTPRSWQNYTFWPLFRGGLGLTLLEALLTAHWPSAGGTYRFALGIASIVVGFGFTIYGYFDLGIGKTYGSDDGLVTDGLYRYSRNPQYVASILGFSGVALANGGIGTSILCGLAVLVYILLPYAEEPWLSAAYGEIYDTYKGRTPRFL
jgi:protein-S-isoprenylcysteine O-methyltransferase Ste14